MVAALSHQQSQALLASEDAPATLLRYSGLTQQELLERFHELREELDAEVVLALVCAAEGAIRSEVRRTRSASRKSAISKAWKQRSAPGTWVRLEVILSKWRAVNGPKQAIDDFGKLYKHRNWLAHGRYFSNKCGLPTVTPKVAYSYSTKLLKHLAAAPD